MLNVAKSKDVLQITVAEKNNQRINENIGIFLYTQAPNKPNKYYTHLELNTEKIKTSFNPHVYMFKDFKALLLILGAQ